MGSVVGCFSQQQLSYWAACTSDPWVVSTITQGYELQFRRRPLAFSRVKMTIVSDPAKALALSQELSALLAKGAIEPVDPLLHPRGFYSRYFLMAKKDGGFHPILDLRGLNRFLKVIPFRMLTAADILRVVTRGEWFTTVDLKDAYFHVPIAPHHQHFLRFAFRGRHFQFRVLPFGLSLSPRVFTRVVAAALAPLQMQGMKVLPYSGRLAGLRTVPGSGGRGYGSAASACGPAGPDGESAEESPGPNSADHIPGDGSGLRCHEGLSVTEAGGRHPPPPPRLRVWQDGAIHPVPPAPGQTYSCLSCGASRLAVLAATADVAKQPPSGPQVAQAPEGQGVAAMPPLACSPWSISPPGHICTSRASSHGRHPESRRGVPVATDAYLSGEWRLHPAVVAEDMGTASAGRQWTSLLQRNPLTAPSGSPGRR